MQTASSAKRTCSESRSASEKTATASTPSSWHARMMRSAISPRFAISTLENTGDAPATRVSARARETPAEGARPAQTGATLKSTCPYSTGSPSSTRISSMVPPISLSNSFMSFIASMMQSVSPSEILCPVST